MDTVNVYPAVRVLVPSVAEITTLYVPVGVVDELDRVTVEVHVGVQVATLNAAVVPEGRPEADSCTAWEVPAVKVAVAVVVTDCPGAMDPKAGERDTERSKEPLTG